MNELQRNQNVYEMWFEGKDDPVGVWITRTTWSSIVARIVHVDEPKGPAPYYGNPKVLVDVYNRDGSLREGRTTLSAPGTFKTYRRIQPPAWAR